MATSLGRVRVVHKGEWNKSTEYEPLDIVSYQGGSFLISKQCVGQVPIVDSEINSEFYQIIASKGDAGEKGEQGNAGLSPTFTVEAIDDGHKVIITGEQGTKEFSLTNGVDGISPTISVSNKVNKKTTITITDKDGTKTIDVLDGADGAGSGDMVLATFDRNNDGVIDYVTSAGTANALASDAIINQSQVNGLTTVLSAKASSIHTHIAEDITDFDTAVDNRIQSAELGVEIDTKVTEGSGNAVSSGAVYDAINNLDIHDEAIVDTELDPDSGNAISNKAVVAGLSGKADSAHSHDASNIKSGVLPIARGGTNVTVNPSMLVNLASTSAASVFATNPQPGVTGKLPVSQVDAGIFSGQMVANASAIANIDVAQVRNIVIGTSDPTTTTCPVGCIYFKLGDPI